MALHSIKQAFHLATQLHRAGRLNEAEKLYGQIIVAEPRHADALHLLGVVSHQTGRKDEALVLIQRSISINPRRAEAHYHLAKILVERNQLDPAVSAYRRAIQLKPGYAEAMNNLGSVLVQQRRFEDALSAYRQAIVCKADYAEAHYNVGNALREMGRLDESLAAFERAISLKPGYVEAHNHRGQIFGALRQTDRAIACFECALELQPGNARVLNNLGNALKDLGHMDEAIGAYRRAIAANQKLAEAHNNLGNALKDQGELDEALACYRQALEIDPSNSRFDSNLLYLLHFHPAFDAKAIAAEQQRWKRMHAEPVAGEVRLKNSLDTERRLRIGYVSPDFRDHVQSFFTIPVLSHHDHRAFEIYLFSSTKNADHYTQQIAGYADRWRDVGTLDDPALCELIRADGIDIVVDLTMHMAGGRPLLFARRPAPVAVSWLAYPGSTGLPMIDYRLSDPHLDPTGMDESVYAERTIRLPNTFWCYDPLEGRDIPVNPLPAMEAGVVTFGCLNNFCKVNEHVIELWARVLGRVESSRLLLLAQPGCHRQRALARFEGFGIDASRIQFVGMQPRADYLMTYHRIDIGLDTFPYNGHTTSLDSLWMGVPVITLVGSQAVGRAGFCQLTNLGLEALAAVNADQFVEIAVTLARDLPGLQSLRSSMRACLQRSPLMDAEQFTRDFENKLREMWERYCQQVHTSRRG